MADKYILDTHALVWYLEGNKRLSQPARATIDDPASELVLPLIALAEAAFVIEKGRTNIPTVADLLANVYADDRIEIYPITLDVLERSLTPEGQLIPELHDRLIVSTGLYLQELGYTVALITTDSVITNAAVIPIMW
jgi:PIN domain nuclease of toxin-antitoxin system